VKRKKNNNRKNPSFKVYAEKKLIFSSKSKWLHPLFEFEKFLSNSEHNPAKLKVEDKIIGRAAALVLIYLGITNINAGVLSYGGRKVLQKFSIEYDYKMIVEKIQCRTEQLLENIHDPKTAYQMIGQIAKQSADKTREHRS